MARWGTLTGMGETLGVVFARGVALFDAGAFWEAHEAWEEIWRVTPSDVPDHHLLKGLIQCAAAAIKARQRRASWLKLALHAEDYLRRAGHNRLGVDVPGYLAAVDVWRTRDGIGAPPALAPFTDAGDPGETGESGDPGRHVS